MDQLSMIIKIFFKELMKLIKRDWPYFLIIMIIFTAAVLFGQRLWDFDPRLAGLVEKVANEKFSGMAEKLKNAPFYLWILTIFVNNILVSLLIVTVGLIFPLLSLSFLIGNGVLIGVFQHVVGKMGLGAVSYYLALLPHGVFELSAIFIATGLGIRLGLIPYRLIFHYLKSDETKPFFQNYFNELRYYGVFIVILLSIAAIIEITVSPALVK